VKRFAEICNQCDGSWIGILDQNVPVFASYGRNVIPDYSHLAAFYLIKNNAFIADVFAVASLKPKNSLQ